MASRAHTLTPNFSAPVCSDAIDANRFGVPTVLYGVRRAGKPAANNGAKAVVTRDPRGTDGESVSITDVIAAANVYALACAELLRGGIPGTDSERDGEMPGATAREFAAFDRNAASQINPTAL